jgi:hypothetical protein
VKIVVIGEAPNQAADALAEAASSRGYRGRLQKSEKGAFAERMLDRVAVTGTCGERIACLSGIMFREFLRRTDRFNVLRRWPGSNGKGDLFPRDAAQQGALRLRRILPGRRVLFLGRRAAGAFKVSGDYLTWARKEVDLPGKPTKFEVAILPHPLGINRWWNDPENRGRAERFLRRAFAKDSKMD